MESSRKRSTVFLLFLTFCVANLHRFSFSFAIVQIQEAFSLSASQMGLSMSVYILGLLIMQIPGGMMADRYNGKVIMMVFLLLWSAFTILTGVVWAFIPLLIIRFLFGATFSMCQIESNALLAQEFPRQERGKANSRVMISAPLMAALTSLIVSTLIAISGWRNMFIIIGSMGLMVLVIFATFFKSPVRDEEKQLKKKNKIRLIQGLKVISKERLMWCSFFTGFCINMVIWGSSSWAPAFFTREHGLGIATVGYVQFVAQSFGIMTTFIGGILLDKYDLNKNRIIATIAAIIGAASFFLMAKVNSTIAAMIFQGIATGMLTYVVLIPNIISLKKIPDTLIGVAIGFTGIGQNIGSLIAPLAMGRLIDIFGSYRPAFILLAAILCVAAIIIFSYPLKKEIDIRAIKLN